MTINQAQALWELCRQGFPLTADEAESCWEEGKAFLPEWGTSVSRSLERLIDRCNDEIQERIERH
jgi:hypothetical protein